MKNVWYEKYCATIPDVIIDIIVINVHNVVAIDTEVARISVVDIASIVFSIDVCIVA